MKRRLPELPQRRDRGFTLIEALVALLALSVGLLGIAALQMTGLRANLSAAWSSQATYLAYDIIDRIRASEDSKRIEYAVPLGTPPPSVVAGVTSTLDLNRWLTNVSNTLPQGRASVVLDPPSNSVVTIRIEWDDARDPTKPLTFVTRTHL